MTLLASCYCYRDLTASEIKKEIKVYVYAKDYNAANNGSLGQAICEPGSVGQAEAQSAVRAVPEKNSASLGNAFCFQA